MMQEYDDRDLDETNQDLDIPQPIPAIPLRMRISGTYNSYGPTIMRQPGPPISSVRPVTSIAGTDFDDSSGITIEDEPGWIDPTATATIDDTATLLPWFEHEELRLDVDGPDPQNVVSGTIKRGLRHRLHWIANLRRIAANTWTGTIWYRDGDTNLLPQTQVTIQTRRSLFLRRRNVRAIFHGGGTVRRDRRYRFRSNYFHNVEFEYDRETGVTPVTTIDTHAHPNRPATLPAQNLSIAGAYRRAGFRVTSGGESDVPSALSIGNGDPRWDDNELHDAMQTYWSRFESRAQWAMWVFFAKQHVIGDSLGGLMFDDIGPNHRQGTAIFYDSFIKNAPATEANPQAYTDRMRFWTACHEMGHGFNLAHSWQKDHPFGSSWIPQTNDNAALSFMNYPFRYPGGQGSFFGSFEYRFTDRELLFLRHAPSRFVQPGNANWFEDHAFENAEVEDYPMFRLHLRTNRVRNVCRFLEPVRVELKLENVSGAAQTVDSNILDNLEHLTLCTRRQGDRAHQVIPLAQRCRDVDLTTLDAGRSLYTTIDVSFGRGGWTIAEPGHYLIQASLDLEGVDVVSNPLVMTVRTAETRDEEILAQDVFNDEVARVLTFRGSNVLTGGMAILQQVTDQIGDNPLARFANLCLGRTTMRNYKLIQLDDTLRTGMTSATAAGAKVKIFKADVEAARRHLETALITKLGDAADTFGHVGLRSEIDTATVWLSELGDNDAAATMQTQMAETFKKRNVLKSVVTEIQERSTTYKKGRELEAEN